MADIQGSPSTSLVPLNGEVIEAKVFNADGTTTKITTEAPATADFGSWTLKQQVLMLMNGPWKSQTMNNIIWGLAYARSIGADVIKGELFPTGDGRWGTSNKYKIRQALATGNIEGIQAEIRDTGKAHNLKAGKFGACVVANDLECTVTITVKGWKHPIVRKALLSRWYKESNPNWVTNPEHMLELNTIAHACEYVSPVGTEEDEFPGENSEAKEAAKLALAKGGFLE